MRLQLKRLKEKFRHDKIEQEGIVTKWEVGTQGAMMGGGDDDDESRVWKAWNEQGDEEGGRPKEEISSEIVEEGREKLGSHDRRIWNG